MPSKWDITIAKADGLNWNKTETKYVHYFSTSNEFWTAEQVANLVADFRKKFPAPDFKVSVTRWEVVGHPMEF